MAGPRPGIDFFSAFGAFAMPCNFWMAFVGLPLMGIGASMLRAGYLGPTSRYVAGEVTPTIRDTLGARFCDDCGRELAAP